MNTKIKFDIDARASLRKGVDTVANTVKVSMGAEGRTVIIPIGTTSAGNTVYSPTKDGVSIAKAIFPEDKYEAIGASLIKEACSRTNSQAGDSTTAAAVLTQAIYNGGLELLDKGMSPVVLKKGIDAAVKDVTEYLDYISVKVSPENLKDVTTISVNGDKHLGKIIADAFNKIGKHGTVITRESDTKETYVDTSDGLQLDIGYYDAVFVNDAIKNECKLKNPFILLNKGKIEKGDAIVKLFKAVWDKDTNNSLVIITDDIDPFVMSTISQNVENGAIAGKICIVKTPQILKIHKELLGDIATLTGAKIVSGETGNSISPEVLGNLSEFIATDKESTLVGDLGNLSSTIAELKERIDNTDNDIDKEDLQERLSRISGGVATLYVGAQTDSELKEKSDRIEDGINATRSALEEGVIPGGGVALMDASEAFNFSAPISKWKSFFTFSKLNDEEKAYNLVMGSIRRPYLQILDNAGIAVYENSPLVRGQGINVSTGDVVDMVSAGIIDSKKSIRCALENAASVAGTFLTTEAVVARYN